MGDLLGDIRWRKHIIGLSLLLLALGLMIFAFFQFYEAQSQLNNSRNAFRYQQSLNHTAFDNRETLTNYLDTYNDFKANGIIGEAQRLQWIETLQKLSNNYLIPRVQFTLEGANSATETTSPYWHTDINMLSTPMRLEMRLSHEGDLFRLMSALQKQALGMFSIDTCELQSVEAREDINYTDKEISGICYLQWYTLADITQHWDHEGGAYDE